MMDGRWRIMDEEWWMMDGKCRMVDETDGRRWIVVSCRYCECYTLYVILKNDNSS